MTDYPYIKTTGKLKEFLEKIPSMDLPNSVSTRWLPKVGFKSNNHRPIIRILDFIGFISSNKPTDRWRSFRVKSESRRILAEGVVEGYGELFRLYPDAYQRSDKELRDFFQSYLTASDQVTKATIGTFRALCSLANFAQPNVSNTIVRETPEIPAKRRQGASAASESLTAPSPAPPMENPTVHIDIEIHIHPDADADQIRDIFKNMATYLYNREVE